MTLGVDRNGARLNVVKRERVDRRRCRRSENRQHLGTLVRYIEIARTVHGKAARAFEAADDEHGATVRNAVAGTQRVAVDGARRVVTDIDMAGDRWGREGGLSVRQGNERRDAERAM